MQTRGVISYGYARHHEQFLLGNLKNKIANHKKLIDIKQSL